MIETWVVIISVGFMIVGVGIVAYLASRDNETW